MSLSSCRGGLRAADDQTPTTASRIDDQKRGAELSDFAMRAGQPSLRHKFDP